MHDISRTYSQLASAEPAVHVFSRRRREIWPTHLTLTPTSNHELLPTTFDILGPGSVYEKPAPARVLPLLFVVPLMLASIDLSRQNRKTLNMAVSRLPNVACSGRQAWEVLTSIVDSAKCSDLYLPFSLAVRTTYSPADLPDGFL